MGKALYRTYRSKSFDEVVGQDHITTSLQNSLSQGTIAHAYLLTGPRGVGKTSIARLLAHAVNNLEYSEDITHLDIIEIDAASNRRIEEIRSLRDKVHIAPVSAKYKVYIIDEVHMLTREAFNALLKTLEEPPSHVLFILATTEFHKVPDTIVSRCIRFTFKPISKQTLVNHLQTIADQEKINIEPEAIELLADHASGSFRDAISLLDQVKNSPGKITTETVELMIGLAPESYINELLSTVESGNLEQVHSSIEQIRTFGSSEVKVASQLQTALRSKLSAPSSSRDPQMSLKLIEDLLDVPASTSPGSKLELALMRATLSAKDPAKPETAVDKKSAALTQEQASSPPSKQEQEEEDINQANGVDLPLPAQGEVEVKLSHVSTEDQPLWDAVLSSLKSRHNTLYGVARMAVATYDEDTLTLCFKFPFHYKKVDDAKSKALISDVLKNLGHHKTILKVELDSEGASTALKAEAKKTVKSSDLSTITNIFGQPEMLES